MPMLEVFFDYACPYCLKGHENLLELLPKFPDITIDWRPCESHPRPERYGKHSDLCIQGMFFALENGVDLFKYHERAYALLLKQRVDVEDISVLAAGFSDILDAERLREALLEGRYQAVQENANDYAYEQSGVWAVPAYRLAGKRLDAVENVGVQKEQLKKILDAAGR